MKLTAKITKRYGNFLLDAELAAESGRPLALLGASGSGKSATLRCLAGIDRPDRGHIELDGRTLFDSEAGVDLPPQKRRVGYLFQQYALFPNMTVERNIAVCLGRLDRAARRARTAELVSRFRLEGAEQLLPRQLSGGQQQRAALARILASEPAAILLDEPLAALDAPLRRRLEQELGDALERFGGPAVWVTHDRGEACRNCGSVCVLDRGRSSPVTGLRELMADPVTVSAALISGCENCVPARPGPEPGTVAVPDWGLTLRCAAPWRAGTAALGVRARHVRPAKEGEENAFFCRTVRVTEDVSSLLAALRPEGAAADAPLLQMELDRAAWAALPDRERVRAAVPPEHLLLLKEQEDERCLQRQS